MSYSEKKIAFIHIPKCGGTSLTRLLQDAIPDIRFCPKRFGNIAETGASELVRYNLFSGHFSYYSTRLIPGRDIRRITTFRDPVRRLISFYRFQRAHDPDLPQHKALPLVQMASVLPLRDFLLHPTVRDTVIVNNPFVRTFLDRTSPMGPIVQPTDSEASEFIRRDPEGALRVALANIRSLSGWVHLEELDADVDRLFVRLGLPAPSRRLKAQSLDDLEEAEGFRKIEKAIPSDVETALIQENVALDSALIARLRRPRRLLALRPAVR